MITISVFGRSDFSDFCEMHHTPNDIINNYKIFATMKDIIPLHITSKGDLVAYYPYTIAVSSNCIDNDNTKGVVYLSSTSQIDDDEKEYLQLKLESIKRYYRSCRRKKEDFVCEKALFRISYGDTAEKCEKQLVDRVAKLGEKATIDGIHRESSDSLRAKWYQLMLDNGWEEDTAYKWVYGWRRWLNKIGADNYGDGYFQERLNLNDNDN